jgi:hypothetical protein
MHLLKAKQVGTVAEFAECIERWSDKYRVSFANILRERLCCNRRCSGERHGV